MYIGTIFSGHMFMMGRES